MKISNNGLDLIKKYEGLRLRPYICPAGVPTIGYGNTFYPNGKSVTMDDPPISIDPVSYTHLTLPTTSRV